MCTATLKPLFRYFGSKKRMAGALAALVPPGTRTLVSPFIGSGVFEYTFATAHPECRVVCYDKDPAIVNFHREALRDRMGLHRAVMAAHARLCGGEGGAPTLTKEQYTALYARHQAAARRGRQIGRAAAVRFYLLMAYSYSGKIGSFASKESFRKPWGLLQELPRNVEVRRGDALSVLDGLIARGPDKSALVYMDPPYMLKNNYYRFEDFDHGRLREKLALLRTPWLLSYDDSPRARALYRGWPMLSLPVAYTRLDRGGARDPRAGHTDKAELLISGFEVPARLKARARRAFVCALHADIRIRNLHLTPP